MLATFCITQQGSSHITAHRNCQDASKTGVVSLMDSNSAIVISAIADGVGSCEHSDIGAQIAVNSAYAYIKKRLKSCCKLDHEGILAVLKSSFENALQEILNYSHQNQLSPVLFDTTLTVTVFDGENLYFGHIGDSGIVALFSDGTYRLITTRHKGEEIGSVYPLACREQWEFKQISSHVVAFVAMTDGVLDFCVTNNMQGSRVYYPFLKPALTERMETEVAVQNACTDWDNYLKSEDFRRYVQDDITFLVVQNSSRVLEIPTPKFDAEQWEEDNKRYQDQQKEILESDYKNWKSTGCIPEVIEACLREFTGFDSLAKMCLDIPRVSQEVKRILRNNTDKDRGD